MKCIGQIFTSVVTGVTEAGLKVLLNDRVEAFCPALHTSDAPLTSTSTALVKRFKLNQKLQVKVWECGKDIIVTHKKSLLSDALPLIHSVEEACVGQSLTGVVSAVFYDNVRVHFNSKISGNLPVFVLVKQGVLDLEEAFSVGQVVKCVVLQKEVQASPYVQRTDGHEASSVAVCRLILGLDIGDTDALIHTLNETASSAETQERSTRHHSFISGAVSKIEEEGGNYLLLRLDDGRAGYLGHNHLTDFSVHAGAFFKQYKAGDRIENALVLGERVVKGVKMVEVTLKPLLLSCCAKEGKEEEGGSVGGKATTVVPKSFRDLTPGMLVAGFITKVDTTGVFVRFREGLSALAPRPNVADRFVANPAELFQAGDSIRCLVQRVDAVKERSIVTFKSLLVGPSSGEACFLRSFLRESFVSFEREAQLAESHASIINWKRYAIGSSTLATVTAVKEYGLILTADDGVTVFLDRSSSINSSGFTVRWSSSFA